MKDRIKKYFLEIATNKRKDPISIILGVLLLLLSYIYWVLIKMYVFLYLKGILKRFSSKLKVISVGNISLGGTGKTPIECYLIKHVFNDKKITLIARGYSHDELDLVQFNFPEINILAGRDRIKLIERAYNFFKPDIVIVDDGFQYLGLRRNIDIVVIDASFPFGNGYLIPRGILREPISHLIRADIFFITKIDAGSANLDYVKNTLGRINPKALIVESRFIPLNLYDPLRGKSIDLQAIRGKSVAAFCGIGAPASFNYTLRSIGVQLVLFKDFIDHYHYRRRDIEEIIFTAQSKNADCLITTEKDWMRLTKESIDFLPENIRFYILKIDVEIVKGKEKLIEYLSSIFNS